MGIAQEYSAVAAHGRGLRKEKPEAANACYLRLRISYREREDQRLIKGR